MDQRYRLIELIKEAKKQTKNAKSEIERNMIFADHLIANGVVVPPCSLRGDIFYIGKGFIQPMYLSYGIFGTSGINLSANCKDDEEFCTSNCEKWKICGIGFNYKDIGKTVFFSREDAEKVLAEINKKE